MPLEEIFCCPFVLATQISETEFQAVAEVAM